MTGHPDISADSRNKTDNGHTDFSAQGRGPANVRTPVVLSFASISRILHLVHVCFCVCFVMVWFVTLWAYGCKIDHYLRLLTCHVVRMLHIGVPQNLSRVFFIDWCSNQEYFL